MVMAPSPILISILGLTVTASAYVIIEDRVAQDVLTGKWEIESRELTDGPFGGGGGHEFTDAGPPANNGVITGIELRSGKYIDAIRGR